MHEATRISDTTVREELQDIPALFWTLVQHDLERDRQELNKVECHLQQSTLRRLLRMLGISRDKEADCAED